MRLKFAHHELSETANKIIAASGGKTLCFIGEMGAGKTTLIKAIVKTLGGADSANSPTFGIVNEYHYADGSLLGYHFDFYRLKNETEALDLGLEDYLDQNVWVFMEWPEKIKSYLPERVVNLNLEILDATTRQITIL